MLWYFSVPVLFSTAQLITTRTTLPYFLGQWHYPKHAPLSTFQCCQKVSRPGVQQAPEGSGEQGKMDKTGCEIICGAPVTLMVKGLMMMMVMIRCTCQSNQSYLTDCGGNIFFQYRSLGKETAALFSTLSETSFSGSLLLHAKGNRGSWGLGIFISNTYSLYCHHQNDSALRWAAVWAIFMFH